MQFLVTLSLLASAVGVFAAGDELKIDVTLPVECDRKTQTGDKVEMHYKGTLENGNKFDASTLILCPTRSAPTIANWCSSLQATTGEHHSASSSEAARSSRGSYTRTSCRREAAASGTQSGSNTW